MALLVIFVALNAAFMGAIVFAPDADRTNRLIALAMFLLLLITMIGFGVGLYRALFDRRISQRRWTRINRELSKAGFRDATESEIEDTLRLPFHILAPSTLAVQRGGGIDHVTVSCIDGHEVRCFNVRIRGGGWTDIPAAAFRVPASFARTLIRPGPGTAPPRPDMRRAMFEEERFNRSIAVFSVNLFFATALVDPRMMEWLKSNLRRNTIEVCGQWVTAWRLPPSAVGRHAEELMKQIELIRGFVYQIPRVVPSLFPALPPPWDERWSH